MLSLITFNRFSYLFTVYTKMSLAVGFLSEICPKIENEKISLELQEKKTRKVTKILFAHDRIFRHLSKQFRLLSRKESKKIFEHSVNNQIIFLARAAVFFRRGFIKIPLDYITMTSDKKTKIKVLFNNKNSLFFASTLTTP